ncbi:MAG: hypothetical protein U5J98_12210 [Halobacteriales archaeon]|nr:hypothetical protein [Halobacteriales archaeon]
MADEFVKGLGIVSAAGLGWMTLSGWYTTPGFEDAQLIGEAPETVDVFGELALVSREMLFWFMVLGALTFWVVIPGLNQVRASLADEDEA